MKKTHNSTVEIIKEDEFKSSPNSPKNSLTLKLPSPGSSVATLTPRGRQFRKISNTMSNQTSTSKENNKIDCIRDFRMDFISNIDKLLQFDLDSTIELYSDYLSKTKKLVHKPAESLEALFDSKKQKKGVNGRLVRFLFDLLSPERKFLFYKNLVIFVTGVIYYLIILFRCSFLMTHMEFSAFISLNYSFLIIDIVVDILYILDFISNFFTPFYSSIDGLLVKQFDKIIVHYMKSSFKFFITDVISIIPLDYIYLFVIIGLSVVNGSYEYFVSLFMFFSIWRLNRNAKFFIKYLSFFSFFERHSTRLKISPQIVRIFKFVLLIFMISHLLCCVIYIISVYEEIPKTILFIEIEDFDVRNVFEKFLAFYHWSVVKITGYGGTIPSSFPQVVFCCVVVIVGIIFNISIIGIVSSIFGNMTYQKSVYRQNFERIKLYISYKGISGDLKKKILNYYLFINENRRNWNETEILDNLPTYLKTELSIQINSKLIQKVNLFQGASKQFVSSVILQLIPRFVLPGQTIIKKGDVGREMYFLTSGRVQVVDEEKGLVFATLEQGCFFGEVALIKQTRRNATVKSITFCDLYVLTKENFNYLEKLYPKEFGVIKSEAKKRDLIKEREKKEKKEQEEKILKMMKKTKVDKVLRHVFGSGKKKKESVFKSMSLVLEKKRKEKEDREKQMKSLAVALETEGTSDIKESTEEIKVPKRLENLGLAIKSTQLVEKEGKGVEKGDRSMGAGLQFAGGLFFTPSKKKPKKILDMCTNVMTKNSSSMGANIFASPTKEIIEIVDPKEEERKRKKKGNLIFCCESPIVKKGENEEGKVERIPSKSLPVDLISPARRNSRGMHLLKKILGSQRLKDEISKSKGEDQDEEE